MPLKKDMMRDKLFDPKAYNTIFISAADEEKVRKEQQEILVELICDDKHKGDKDDVLHLLKREPKAQELLISAIENTEGDDKRKLLTACWEADIDVTSHIDLFIDSVINDDFPVALEALTSIENLTGKISPEKAEEMLNLVMTTYPLYVDTPKGHLLTDLSEVIAKWR